MSSKFLELSALQAAANFEKNQMEIKNQMEYVRIYHLLKWNSQN
jgi:hypothetical protein